VGASYVTRSAAGQISGLPALIAAGRASCGLGRWGDYSAVARDPSDASLWTVQEFEDIASGGGAWGTWICEVKFP
jgi:hypothetical protein